MTNWHKVKARKKNYNINFISLFWGSSLLWHTVRALSPMGLGRFFSNLLILNCQALTKLNMWHLSLWQDPSLKISKNEPWLISWCDIQCQKYHCSAEMLLYWLLFVAKAAFLSFVFFLYTAFVAFLSQLILAKVANNLTFWELLLITLQFSANIKH